MIRTPIATIATGIGFVSAPILQQAESATGKVGLAAIENWYESLPDSLGYLAVDLAYFHSLTLIVVFACIAFGYLELRSPCVALLALRLGCSTEHLVVSAREIFVSDQLTGYRYQIEVAATVSTVIAGAGGYWFGQWLRSPRISLLHLIALVGIFGCFASTIDKHHSWQASAGLPIVITAFSATLPR
ncbi:MAG: hypothetical protein AAGI63_09160, partial [Planctomycetota bacterium]